jgi:hypothetical protein
VREVKNQTRSGRGDGKRRDVEIEKREGIKEEEREIEQEGGKRGKEKEGRERQGGVGGRN